MTNLCVDLTDPYSIPVEDVRLGQVYKGSVVKDRHVIDTKGLLKGDVNRIARCLGTAMHF